MGEMQNIVYGEYLPTILGVDFMKTYGLIVEEETRYDPTVDPTIFTSFGTAAFRLVTPSTIRHLLLGMSNATSILFRSGAT